MLSFIGAFLFADLLHTTLKPFSCIARRRHFFGSATYTGFKNKVNETGLNKSVVLRHLIASCEVIPTPKIDYAAYIRELREVGSKFNRILISARTAGFINSSEVQKACDELKISEDKMFSEIRELKNREIKDHLE